MTQKLNCAIGLLVLVLLVPGMAIASLNYQIPEPTLEQLATAELAPSVRVDSQGRVLLLLSRDRYPTIAELSEPEIRIAGLRVNPDHAISSRIRYFNQIAVRHLSPIDDGAKGSKPSSPKTIAVKGLPQQAKLAYFTWSPDESKVAFTHTCDEGVELWILDVKSALATRVTQKSNLNASLGKPFIWSTDGQSLLIKRVPENQSALIETASNVPSGPTVADSMGAKAQNRTYQDLLKTPADAYNFEQLARSYISRVTIAGVETPFLPPALYQTMTFSPDGQYLLTSVIKRPFSYLVPYYRFAGETAIWSKSGKLVSKLIDRPVEEVRPKGFMATTREKRGFQWRADTPASITWIQALDEGDPEKIVPYRDALFELEAPFTGQPRQLLATQNRLQSVHWGNADHAIAEDYWFDNRNTKSYAFSPSNPDQTPTVLFDRNYQDRYQDPGTPVKVKDARNQLVLALQDGGATLFGEGFTPEGQFPFMSRVNLKSGTTNIVYQSAYTRELETLLAPLDTIGQKILVRIEAPNAYPNYYIRNVSTNALTKITDFESPFKALDGISKEVIDYPRNDGLPLSGTLYLPAGFDVKSHDRLPLLLWAYPVEYKDASSAGQQINNANEFTYPSYGSPVFWATQGFAVLDDAAFPIVGVGEAEPNDAFRSQLIANAKAAIDHLDQKGLIDPNRVAVGGHSYGAFMVANLLSHSNLFAAGIARSGAYNRTLTPFGFQREARSYWEAPSVYYDMSPFMHADKMKTPLLLIHGEADNNSGTYPMQSERYFNALKGLGAPARLVMLPKESHGYRAKESVLHMLWEQDQWLKRYVTQPVTASP